MNLLEQYRSNKDFIVNTNEEYKLHSVKYVHNSIDWSNPIALQARGIVLDDRGTIIARPYNKFFNLNELKGTDYEVLSDWIDGAKHTIETKEDGSLAIFFKNNDEILAASSGVVMGEYAKLFLNTLNNKVDSSKRDVLNSILEENTMICEYVAPTNRIVLNYDEEDLIVHGIIHTSTGRVFGREWTESIANYLGLKIVRRWSNLTKEDLLLLQNCELDTEGYVVKFENGHTIKVKTKDYVEKHRSTAIFFGRPDTINKVKTYVVALFDREFDDILGSCDNESTREYLNEIQSCYHYYLNNRRKAIELVENGLLRKDYFKGESSIKRSYVLDHLLPMAFDNNFDKFKKFVTDSIVREFSNRIGGEING
ncbi:RNA ligase [Vagococcus fluvialis]|uniref:RNA ligase n=1 Tax=Vagococcus fluvialis TaxID=2738 RepID=UPI001D0A7729|nr:RNA ligase [Vagococcus fluvialis]UDM72657.1 hypothetical protein K5L00_14815 [Vagococcus fluvialis]UDM78380.1 hypothetical protein K5K98_15020 [Vagococcus fluvialis]UDM83932.1 hypothetical protein K5K96_14840 [Vagococcus fluvialis]